MNEITCMRMSKIMNSKSRELKRCGNEYDAIYAQKDKIEKSSSKGRKTKADGKLTKSISEKLHKKWSPEQIANTICKDVVCFKTIYNWIYLGMIEFDVSKLRRKGKSIEKNQKKSKKGIPLVIGN